MAYNSDFLTKSEEELMEIIWASEVPLTSVEILKLAKNRSWSGSYIHIMLRSILKKKLIKECGTVRYGTQYARQFEQIVTKEEYAAKLAMSTGIKKGAIAKVAVAMAKETGDEEEVIAQLEEIIKELRDKGEK